MTSAISSASAVSARWSPPRIARFGRSVALKTPKHSDAQPSVIERFVNEARLTAQLEHPSVVPVYDMGTLPNGQPFYTMRVVKRQSLQDVLGNSELRKQWSLVRLVGVFVQVSRALAYAHSRGVLHRDIKPENILLGDFGEVYLADWGNAKTLACPEGVDPIAALERAASGGRAAERPVGDAGLHRAGADPRRSRATSITAPTSSRSASCSTRC